MMGQAALRTQIDLQTERAVLTIAAPVYVRSLGIEYSLQWDMQLPHAYVNTRYWTRWIELAFLAP